MKTPALIAYLLLFGITSFLISCDSESKSQKTETEWISLFNGRDFEGWKEYNADSINSKWEVSEGVIMVSRQGGDGIRENTGFGKSIITEDSFDNFILALDFRLSKGANSGIMYHVVEDTSFNHDYETAPEYQLLDDEFAISESLPHRQVAANYDLHAPDSAKILNPAGEWNTAKIVYDNGHVEHWLNGKKVLEFEEGNEEWEARYENSKFPNFPAWGKSKSGHFSLQDHGDYVSFRNIRVKKL